MSIISDTHSLVPFISGESKPMNGQRLAKVGFKASKNKPAPFKSVCASIPFLGREEVLGNIEALLPHIGNWLEGVQDQILRSLYEGSKGQRTDVRTEELNIRQCVAFLNAESTGSRLSVEGIKQWFASELEETVMALVADKLGYAAGDSELTQEQETTCRKHAAVYGELLGQLAGKGLNKGSFSEKQWKGLETALGLAPEDDPMAQKLSDKIQAIKQSPSVEELLEL